MEYRTRSENRIFGGTEPDSKRESTLLAGLRGCEEGIECPVVRFRRSAGWIHRLDIDAGVPLHQVNARARTLDLTADRGWHGYPTAIGFAEIFGGRTHGAILLDQRRHDVIERLEIAGIIEPLDDVMAALIEQN